MAKLLRYWGPVVLWLALITLFSTGIFHGGFTYRLVRAVLLAVVPDLSPETVALIHLGVRKLAHVLEYFVLTLLLYRAFRQDALDGRHWRWALYSLTGAVAFAGMDELHQRFHPLRTGSPSDVAIDAVGILMSQLLLWWRRGQLPKGGSQMTAVARSESKSVS